MTKDFVQILKDLSDQKRKYFENYLEYSKKIKEKAQEILGEDVRVLVFGSVVRGDWWIGSDIDILIISDKLSPNWIENREIRTAIRKSVGPFNPFQVHLATPEEYETWYKKFIKDDYLEI